MLNNREQHGRVRGPLKRPPMGVATPSEKAPFPFEIGRRRIHEDEAPNAVAEVRR